MSISMEKDEIDIEHLISLVEERPVLWDKSIDDYKNRNLTTYAWREVCCELHEDFEDLNERQKAEYGKFVIKKWTNIKDSWLKVRKKRAGLKKPGSRRLYVYDDKLTFLEKNLHITESGASVLGQISTPIAGILEETTDPETEITPPPAPERIHRPSPFMKKLKKRRLEKIEQDTASTSEPQEPHLQDNRHLCFFKGIIPSLEDFSEEQIIEFQMGVLNCLMAVREGRRSLEPAYDNMQPGTILTHHFAAKME